MKLFTHEWDALRQHVIPDKQDIWRTFYLYEIEKEVNAIQQAMAEIIKKLDKYRSYTIDDIVSRYTGRSKQRMFYPFMSKKIQELKAAGKENTAEKYATTLRIFSNFKNNTDIPLHQLTKKELKAFENYLKARALTMNTISFYMRILRATYNKAVSEELITQQYPFIGVYTGICKTEKRAIDSHVIHILHRLSLDPYLAYARDLFLFSFYTRGMAFVDMAYLKKSDCQNGYLYYKRKKTGQQLIIRIEPCIREIIQRYSNLCKKSDCLLPIMYSNGHIIKYASALRLQNNRLKKISEIMSLKKPLTSYVARHSWASVASKKGVALKTISEGMGHTSEKTTRIYLSTLNQQMLDKANKKVIEGVIQ